MNVSWLTNHHVEQGRTGTQFQAKEILHSHPMAIPYMAIPYTHNNFWNHG